MYCSLSLVQGQCPTFTLCFLSWSEGCSQNHLDSLVQQLFAGCPYLLCYLLKNIGVSPTLNVRGGPVTKSTLSCSCACSPRGRMGVRIKPPCLVPPDCLLETEWEQVGWGPLGTVGLCGSRCVSIKKAKLSDMDNLTTLNPTFFFLFVF